MDYTELLASYLVDVADKHSGKNMFDGDKWILNHKSQVARDFMSKYDIPSSEQSSIEEIIDLTCVDTSDF